MWVFRWVLSPFFLFIGLWCLINNFRNAIKHNRSLFLGLLIGCFKLVFLSLAVFFVLAQLNKFTDKSASSKDKIAAAVILGISVVLAKAMINGPSVYDLKGWPIEPDRRG